MNADFRGPCSTEPDTWYSQDPEDITLAKAICQGCPMRDACLQVALENDERYGVWGGLTERERARLTRAAKRLPRVASVPCRFDGCPRKFSTEQHRGHHEVAGHATHCRHGHEFTPENTLATSKGRRCRTCTLEAKRASRERRKEAS